MLAIPKDGCVLCSNLIGAGSSGPWDTVVNENDQYVIAPTKGSILPGWLLVISKQHMLCAGELDETHIEATFDAIHTAKGLLEPSFGPVTVFEHGPAEPGTPVGCGIDHLHLHVVALPFSLSQSVTSLHPQIVWHSLRDLRDLKALHESRVAYAFVQEPTGLALWCRAPASVRQMFRQAIADALGVPSEYDYSRFPQTENVITTLQRLSPGA